MSKEPISFEKLPEAVSQLSRTTNKILEILLNGKQEGGGDHWMNLNDLINYLPGRPAKITVYHWVSTKTIPFHKKGKHLYFLKSDIDEWMRKGRKKTLAEIKDSDHTA